MSELFGIPMNTIMVVLLALFGVSIATVGFIFITNRTMFKMGLRNLPKRGLQTGLVVLGLMLATLITTASFTTGDTIDHSIENLAYDVYQRTDLALELNDDTGANAGKPVYIDEAAVSAFEDRFAANEDIDGFVPFLFEPVPAINQRTRLSEPSVMLTGVDAVRLDAIGGLRLVSGGTANIAALADTDVLLNESAAEELDARTGDVLTIHANGVPRDVRVAGIVEDELATGTNAQFDSSGGDAGAVMSLAAVQQLTGHEGEINYLGVALKGDVRSSVSRSDSAVATLEPFVQSAEGRALLGIDDRPAEVVPVKQDAVEEAEEFGNLFTSFFLILGLFSIAAGVMLIFMIFVMLAAERKAEMGMARAVGAQRSNLVQSFLSEGMAYNLIAGAVGAALGVAAAVGLVIGFLRYTVGDDFDFLTAHVTARSLIISYCLGAVLTFITVVISSMKVSSVNIVAAIRGIEEDEKRKPRAKVNWKWVAIGVPAMIVPPLGIWFLFNKGLGISWAWILGPLGVALGLLCILGSSGNGSELLFSVGFSIIPLALALLASHYRVNGRVLWTLVGAYLAAYWLAPFSIGEKVLGKELEGDIEMFPVSGVMIAIAFTLIIVHNARLLTTLFQRSGGSKYLVPAVLAIATVGLGAAGFAIGDRADGVGQLCYLGAVLLAAVAVASYASVRFPRLAPALKMGVAYPLSNRFRTGMTIAMFTLIIFSLTTFSAVNANFASLTTGGDGDGGWDVLAISNRNNPINDLQGALRESQAPADGMIEYTGRATTYTGSQEVREPAKSDEWQAYPVIAVDDAFLAMPDAKLDGRAEGYDDARAVFDAVRSTPGLALVDGTGWSDYEWTKDVTIESDDTFEAFDIEFRDPATGQAGRVTVIGVLASKLTSDIAAGIYVPERTYAEVFGAPEYDRTYVRLEDGVKPQDAARTIESTLSTSGVQADSIRQLLDDAAAMDRAFTRMFQGFMALGLFVGIAALGVIAFRSVVERRQQIGMLRAIGYQRGTVALTFVLESAFVAVMGIVSGVVGGVIVSRNLFTTGQFSGEGVEFMIPWTEVIVVVATAFVVSLLMTWWPSRNAASVPVADALRYE